MEWDAMHSSCPFTSPSSTSTMPARKGPQSTAEPMALGCPSLYTACRHQGSNGSERCSSQGPEAPLPAVNPPASRGKRRNSPYSQDRCSQGAALPGGILTPTSPITQATWDLRGGNGA